MTLVYKRSTKKSARQYERSSGMESNRGLRSNPGVNALTVVNSGRPRDRSGRFLSGRPSGRAPKANPFQWIGGRKQHIHMSPQYRDLRGAKKWMGNHPNDLKGRGRARLYATDEYGTVLTRAIPKRMLKNPTRRSGMAYNIGALRRAMRANYKGSEDMQSVLTSARRSDTGGGNKPRSRHSQPSESASSGGMTIASTGRRPRRRTSGGKQHNAHVRAFGARKAAATRASKKAARSRAAKKAARTRKRNASKRGASRRASKRGGRSSKRGGSRRSSKRRGSRRRASRRGSKRRSSKRFFHGRHVRLTGRSYIDKYLARGLMPTITRVGRLPLSRSGRPSIMTYPIPRTVGRLSRRSSVRGSSRRGYAVGATYRGRRKRRMSALAANRRRRSRRNSRRRGSRRSSRRNSRRRGSRRRVSRNQTWVVANRRRRSRRNSRRRGSRRKSTRNQMVRYATMTSNRRRSRRNSRRRSSRRNTGSPILYATANRRRRSRRNSRRRGSRRGYVVMNRRRSRRNSRRRHSRRRATRNRRHSRRRMTRNMLAVSKLKYRGAGSHRVGTPKGRYYQLVEFGPKSGRKYRHAGYPVLVPPHVSQHSYVRKFRFGGAAKDAHARAKSGGYSEKRYGRWRKPPAWYTRRSSKKMTANRRRKSRRNSRRSSMRKNQTWIVRNRRKHGRRHVRRNGILGGADLMRDVVTPVIGGTVGFVAARLLSNGLANVPQLRGMLDRGAADAAGASNTKIAANLLGIAATLGLSTKVGIIRQNRGALVTGMGLALTDRLIQRFAAGTPYGGYLGEYVNQPMSGFGEYVNQPMSGFGEYVNQPMSGLGETMFAAAGMGATQYAAAGVGDYAEGVDPANQANVDAMMNGMEGVEQAAAGMGEADARLQAMWGQNRPPFTSTEMPEGVALAVHGELPLDRDVQTSMVTPEARVGTMSTPEGRGFAGGLFARNLFGGMF